MPATVAAPAASLFTHWFGSPEQKKSTYLSRCVEQLDPNKITSLQRETLLWKTAAISSVVAYTALSVGIFVFIGIYSPIYTPITGISLLLCAQPTIGIYKQLMKNSQEADGTSLGLTKIQKQYKSLSKLSSDQFKNKLTEIGISHSINRKKAKALLARYKFFEKSYAEQEKAFKKELRQLNKQQTAQSKKPFKVSEEERTELHEAQAAVLNARTRALETKIKAAFVNALLRKNKFAKFAKTEDAIYQFSSYGTYGQLLGQECNDPNAEIFVHFKKKGVHPITLKNTIKLPIAELGEIIAKAI